MQYKKPKWRLRLSALFFVIFGAFLMMLLVVAINKKAPEKKDAKKSQMRYVEVKKTKAAPKAKPKPKPKKHKRKAPPKAPLPSLSNSLSGLEMDIPELMTDELLGDANKVLGDIGKDTIMNENSVDVKPKVISRAPISYPKNALRKHIKGYVVINLLIAEDGSVEIAKVLDSSPPGVFDSAALSGVRSWRFSPAQYKGKAVKIWAKQNIKFDFE